MVSQSCPVTVKTVPSVVSRRPLGVGVESRRGHQEYALRWSGGGICGALVLDRDAAQRVVLALRVAGPVVGHLDAGQAGWPSKTMPKKSNVSRSCQSLRRVDRHDRRDVRVAVGAGRPRAGPAGCG